MIRINLTFCLLITAMVLKAQGQILEACANSKTIDYLHGNNIRASIGNAGTLFFDGSSGQFLVPSGIPGEFFSTIFNNGLWVGGYDPSGNLKVAAIRYGMSTGKVDYWPGPLLANGTTENTECTNWNRIWSVRRYELETHIADYSDNGVVDNPLPSIFGWPAKGNPFFENIYGFNLPSTSQGLAPFFDHDGNGLYDPSQGDYPLPENIGRLPEHLVWCVFNDEGGGAIHLETNGLPMKFEIQFTAWSFFCHDQPVLNRTIFTSHKFINRGKESLDSIYAGYFNAFDTQCKPYYLGCRPELNTYFRYHYEPYCLGDDIAPPVQAVTFLNREMSHFKYLNCSPLFQSMVYYKALAGEGITFGEDGCNPENPPTAFAFPGDPLNPNEWSMYSAGISGPDYSSLTSVYLGTIAPGGVKVLETAYSYHKDENLSNDLENVHVMYDEVAQLQTLYDQHFSDGCQQLSCQVDCVWPGDANHDGIANYCDLLPIGMSLGKAGPGRQTPNFWAPFTALKWSDNIPGNVNRKHVDCDGSGEITPNDFKLTVQHYDFEVPQYVPPLDEYQEGPELFFTAAGSASFTGLTAGESIIARANVTDVPDLYGLTYQVEFDQRYFKEFQAFSPGYSQGVNDLKFHTKTRSNFPMGVSDHAFSKTQAGNTIQAGILMPFTVKTHDSYPETLPSNQTTIRFKNIKAIRSDGSEITIGGTSLTATFNDITTLDRYVPEDAGFRVYPNPTSGEFTILSPGRNVVELMVTDVYGNLLLRQNIQRSEQVKGDLSNISSGVYFVFVKSGDEWLSSRLVLFSK